jgi:hypothetical protein
MAVARITASRSWFLKAAGTVKDQKRLARELLRAADRYGHSAELQGDEARILAERMPKDERAQKAWEEVQALYIYEAERPRARDIVLASMRRGVGADPADPSYRERNYERDEDSA